MEWQPIETAPKDTDILLRWEPVENGPVAIASGRWLDDQWAYVDPFDGWWVRCTGIRQPLLWCNNRSL